MNRTSIGICLEGCYQDYKNQTNTTVPPAQLESLRILVSYLMREHNIPVDNIHPHSKFSTKLCPGNYFPWDNFIGSLGGVVSPPKPRETFKLPTNIILRRGSRGQNVRLLQAYLNRFGYVCGPADGIFGPKTKAALRRFQRAESLTVDGIAGPQTLGRMKQMIEGGDISDIRPNDVFRVRVNGRQLIALTGYENARGHAERTYPNEEVSLENIRTGEVYKI